jgi:hypothetical protein
MGSTEQCADDEWAGVGVGACLEDLGLGFGGEPARLSAWHRAAIAESCPSSLSVPAPEPVARCATGSAGGGCRRALAGEK